ncbi:hypothetical protein RSAG8_01813, partial [Rhizoctonia solani AG-8 WAC10335]
MAPAFVPAMQPSGIIPPTGVFKALRSCPPPLPTFVGEEDVLTQMDRCIFDGTEGRRVFVLYGLGGAGKTQLALKFTQMHRNKFSEVFYIDASSAGTIEIGPVSFVVFKKAGKGRNSAIEWLLHDIDWSIYGAEQRTTILLALSTDNDFGADDHEYRAKLASHIDALSAELRPDPNIARKFAMMYDEAGRFQVVKSLREAAVVEADKRIFGVDHPDTLADMLDLANAYIVEKWGTARG